MSSKTLRILLAAFVVLLAAWGIAAAVSARRDRRAPVAPALAGFFDGVTEATVAAVRLESPRDTVRLERQGDGWSANGYRPDSGAVARFWTALEEAGVGDLASTNPSNHRRMGLASDSALRVELDLGGRRRSVLLGKTGPQAVTYVRLPGADTAYLLEGDLYLRADLITDDWRDRRILAVDTSAVARIAVDLDGPPYTITRGDSTWTLIGGGQADPAVVRTMLTELARFRALGFLEPGDSIARKPRGGTIIVLTTAGDTLAVVTVGAGPGDRWVRARGDSVLYHLGYYRVERVAPPRRQLRGGN